MEEEKGQRRAPKCSKEMGQERKESAILIGKKWEHSIVKPRERMAQSEALHVASTREERERDSRWLATRRFPSKFSHFFTTAKIENAILNLLPLYRPENLINGLLSCIPDARDKSQHPIFFGSGRNICTFVT